MVLSEAEISAYTTGVRTKLKVPIRGYTQKGDASPIHSDTAAKVGWKANAECVVTSTAFSLMIVDVDSRSSADKEGDDSCKLHVKRSNNVRKLLSGDIEIDG